MNSVELDRRGVGPVLQATPFAEAIVAAIQDENDGVDVRYEGAYLRAWFLTSADCRALPLLPRPDTMCGFPVTSKSSCPHSLA